MKNEYSEFLSVPDKTIKNKMCIKNNAEVFFYHNVITNFSSGGTDFLILVSWNVQLGPSKTSSLSNVAPETLKYLKKTFVDVPSGLRTGSRIFL